MKQGIIISLFALFFLLGCDAENDEHAYIETPNGQVFSILDPDASYFDTLLYDNSHLYAIHVKPGYLYTIDLDTTQGDSDLYLYYDGTLSNQSLLGYSDFAGTESDSVTFYADFDGVVYIEVYAAQDSKYLVSYAVQAG